LQDVAELRVRKMESLGGARCSRRVGRFASAFPWGEQGARLPRGSKLHSKVRVGRRGSVTDEVFGRDSQCPPQAAEERNESREVAAATLPLQNVLKRSRAPNASTRFAPSGAGPGPRRRPTGRRPANGRSGRRLDERRRRPARDGAAQGAVR
jgi:hypothetical protein